MYFSNNFDLTIFFEVLYFLFEYAYIVYTSIILIQKQLIMQYFDCSTSHEEQNLLIYLIFILFYYNNTLFKKENQIDSPLKPCFHLYFCNSIYICTYHIFVLFIPLLCALYYSTITFPLSRQTTMILDNYNIN